MTLTQKSRPSWKIEKTDTGLVVTLYGSWTILSLRGSDRKRFVEQLRLLSDLPSTIWQLGSIDALDSAGALFLWRVWGERCPPQLKITEIHRRLFAHLDRANIQIFRPSRYWLASLEGIGHWLTSLSLQVGGIALLMGQIMVDAFYCVRNPRALPLKELSAVLYRAGAQSLALLALIGFLVGVVLTYQIGEQLMQYGQTTAIVGAVGLAFLRELGPFVAGIIMVGRSGASFTAGIGAMRMTGEIDALRSLGASPTLRLVLPRVLGLTIAMPLLVVWTDFWGFIGAILVSSEKLSVGYRIWVLMFPTAVPWSNFFIGFGKGVLFGGIIGLVSSYYGLEAKPNTQSLTENTIRSVVFNLTLVLVIDGLLGISLSGIGLG